MAAVASPPAVHSHHIDVPDASDSCSICHDGSSSFEGDIQMTDELPTQTVLDECANLPVYDSAGGSRPFSSLLKDNAGKKHLIIFIRHVYCGICQQYVEALCSSITPAGLLSAQSPSQITIIGCGDASLIPDYQRRTKCSFSIYMDPSRKLYEKFGLNCTFDPGPQKPKYQTTAMSIMAMKSISHGLSNGLGALKGGNFRQVGGEFLFDPAGKPIWCHRMRNTRDHTEVAELASILGVETKS